MPDANLVTRVTAVVRAAAKIAPTVAILPQSRLVEDLGIDSLDLVGVYLQVQDEFGVVIDEVDIPKLARVEDVARHVAALAAADAA